MEWYTRMFIALLLLLSAAAVFALQVDVNKADAEALADNLLGIGSSKANAIVAHRTKYGPFRTTDDLMQVKGVGEKTIELNRGNILFGELSDE